MMRTLSSLGGLSALCALVALGGCTSMARLPEVEVAQPTTAIALPVVATRPRAANGAIYQPDRYRPLFEDYRARLVGDTVTVQIAEKVSAVQKSTSTVAKDASVDAAITALPLIKSNSFGKAAAGGNQTNKFEGKGTTENSNDFSGTITAVVIQVLPNGHLVIAGEKQVGVNRSVDVLRFSGIVDPRRLQPGSVIDSRDVANVRVISRGLGEQAEAQAMGWLGRAFNSITPF